MIVVVVEVSGALRVSAWAELVRTTVLATLGCAPSDLTPHMRAALEALQRIVGAQSLSHGLGSTRRSVPRTAPLHSGTRTQVASTDATSAILARVPHDEDRALVAAILGGDRDALCRLVAREHSWLVRLAKAIVKDDAVADEIVQDAWIAVIRSLASFEGRSSLRTWMATIVLNRAKTTAVRGARTVAVGALGSDVTEDEDTVDRSRFGSLGFWAKSGQPGLWHEGTPEVLLQRRQVLEALNTCLLDLPENQRAVLTLRDVEGWSSDEVCNALDLTESNQRVLLHRARAKVRAALETLLGGPPSS